jgi:hypothetical protein
MRMVVVTAAVLEIAGKVRVPPAEPPMYPTSEEPEQPEQETSFAPDARELLDDSPSGVVSLGPALHVPAEALIIQFTLLAYDSSVFPSPEKKDGGLP